jgi:type III pantothenate kinase
MQSGLFYGYLGLTEGLITRIQAEHGSKLQVIATGGLGELFSQHSAMIDEYAPDLTMRGLYLIHNHLVENHPA